MHCGSRRLAQALGSMRIAALNPSCPHCSKQVLRGTLRSIPFKGKLKWYQFTPSPRTACPHCGGIVTSSLANSPWLWLIMVSFVPGFLVLFVPALSFLAHGWWQFFIFLLPAIGMFFAVKANRLLPAQPEK